MANLPNRDAIEKEFQKRLMKLFKATREEIDRLWRKHGRPAMADADVLLEGYRLALTALITPELEDIYTLALEANESIIGFAVDWGLFNERAADWASNYAFDKVRDITATQRRVLQKAVDNFYRQGLDLDGLTRRLTNEFGERRARGIAITETTRAASQAEVEYVAELARNGVEMKAFWVTNADDLVCPKCGPLNGKKHGTVWTDYPPLHPGCRCWVRHEIVLTGKAVLSPVGRTVVPTLEMAQTARRGLKMQTDLGYGGTSVLVLVAKAIAERQPVTIRTASHLRRWLARADDHSMAGEVSKALCGGATASRWMDEQYSED